VDWFGGGFVVLESAPQTGEGLGEQTRDVHLGDAEALRDLLWVM
jgi:hypothetical protein